MRKCGLGDFLDRFRVTPGATSRSTRPSGVTSITASSVTIMSTTSDR